MNDNLIRDALYNLHPRSGASEQYGRGIVVGIVTTIMADGVEFDTALKSVCRMCPKAARIACFPEEWRAQAQRNLSNSL